MQEQLRGNEHMSSWRPVSGSVVDANTDPVRTKENKVDQDRVEVNDTQGIYVLCDGVAGEEGGREAAELVSKTAANYLARYIEPANMPVTETWRKFGLALQAAQQALRGRSDFPAASSTAVMAKVERGAKGTRILEGVSIGDSRAYVWDGSKGVNKEERLQLITHDNSILYDYCVKTGKTQDYLILQKEVDNGKDPLLFPGFMEFFNQYHKGTRIDQIHSRILASTRECAQEQVSYFKRQIDEHDRVLICSDGLYEVLTFDEINDVFIKHKHLNAQHLANKLKEAARNKIKNNPDKKIKNDDISVIIIDSNDRPKPKFTPLQKRIALSVVTAAGVIATALGIGHIGSDDNPVVTPPPKPLSSPTSTPTSAPYRPTVRPTVAGGVQVGPPPTATAPPTLEYKVPVPKPTSTLYIPPPKKP